MNKRELKEELKKTRAGNVFLEEAGNMKELANNSTNEDLIEFAKEHCDIFPEIQRWESFLRKLRISTPYTIAKSQI